MRWWRHPKTAPPGSVCTYCHKPCVELNQLAQVEHRECRERVLATVAAEAARRPGYVTVKS